MKYIKPFRKLRKQQEKYPGNPENQIEGKPRNIRAEQLKTKDEKKILKATRENRI